MISKIILNLMKNNPDENFRVNWLHFGSNLAPHPMFEEGIILIYLFCVRATILDQIDVIKFPTRP